LEHDDSDMCESAALALGKLGDTRAVPALIERLSDMKDDGWSDHVCDAVTYALRKIGTPEALAAVEEWERNGRGLG
jgi:HEAT repeat protein